MLLERYQAGEQVFGYQMNRIIDALSALRTDSPSLINSYAVGFGYQPVDATYKARCRFWITPNVTSIIKVYLSFTLQPFHVGNQTTAQSTATTSAGGSAHAHTVTIGNHQHSTPGHQHTVATDLGSDPGATTGTRLYQFGQGTLDIVVNSGGAGNLETFTTDGGSTSGSGGATTPTSSADNTHTHSVSIPSLTLDAPTAIYEAGMAQGVHVFIDGVDQTVALGGPWGNGSATDISALDITSFITTVGWHGIQLSSTAIGGITTQIQLQSLLDSTT